MQLPGLFPLFPLFPQPKEQTVNGLPTLEQEALHGPAGEYALAVEPYTEACPTAVLVSVLVAFGNAAHRNAFMPVGGQTHYANEFALLVGPTATARKGESMQLGVRPIEQANPDWSNCLLGGFGSGEAIVDAVRDPTVGTVDGEEKVLDQGVSDKRLFVFEEELAHVIAVAGRDGSTLSSLWRKAWDGRRLENRTKARRLTATGAHVSALAGITPEELVRRMPETEYANGFMNRFLIVAVRRTRQLPSPPRIPPEFDSEWAERFGQALAYVRKGGAGAMHRAKAAELLWQEAYCDELSVERPGLAGAVCSRAEAHTLRLSMLYALLDCSRSIRYEHVQAALALWHYCERSAYLIFGDRLGDPIADAIVTELRERGRLTRTEANDLFGGHVKAGRLDEAFAVLTRLGQAYSVVESTNGRPLTVLFPCGKSELSGKSDGGKGER